MLLELSVMASLLASALASFAEYPMIQICVLFGVVEIEVEILTRDRSSDEE